jgi:putative thiamine transport system ATP-binding protein
MSAGLAFDVTIRRGERTLLALAAGIPPGEALAVMGPSGSGKSTLLAWLMGELPREFEASGTATLDGRPLGGLRPHRRRLGLLYQDPLLFPHLSVAANLAFGLPRATRGAARRARIEAALEEIGLGGYGPRDPATLSGGQAARVALMRTLLAEPRALLLDEPFSKLDAELRERMRRLVLDRARAAGMPVLLVTHDAEDAAATGGQVLRLG